MNFSFGSPTTTTANTFGTATSPTGFAFGSGDPSKPLFGAASADAKPAFNFSSPTTNAGSFAFGQKTMAASSSMFGAPSTTNAGSAFGAIKPGGFENMMAPPNQTVGSPGFGQPATQSISFGGMQQQQAPPAFGTPATQAAVPGAPFGSPSNSGFAFNKAGATTGFSFATPASGFSAPQQAAATTTSTAPQTSQPGFGATSTPALSLGQTSAFGTKSAFSFGGAPTSAPPAFGSTTVSAAPPPFGASPSGGFALPGQQASQPTIPQTGSSFGATTSAPLSFGGPAAVSAASTFGAKPGFQTSVTGFGSTAAPVAAVAPVQQTLSFGSSTPTTQPTAGLSLAPPASSQPSLSFGTPAATNPPTQASTGLRFSAISAQPTGLSFSSPTTAVGFTTPSTASQPVPLSFGTPPSTSQPATGLSFAAPATTQQVAPALSFASTAPSQPTGLNFGTTSAPSQTKGLSFGSTVATTSQPTTGIPFGTTSTPSTQATGLFATTTSSGLSFGAKTQASTIASSIAATSAPSGITALGKSTAATTQPSLTTATTTTASVPPQMVSSITFAQLEENINKWTLELEEQEKTFINQATQINAWDRLLIANGEKIVELNDEVQTVKNEQQSLEHELDFVLAQQKELEDLLTPMEKQLLEDTGDRMRDPEREHMYSLAENLDTQLRQMSEDLKEVIEHLNETNRSQDSNDPIVQIGRILNAHMSSMQWIDNSIAQISTKLDQLKTTHDTLRRDNERSFQLTYN